MVAVDSIQRRVRVVLPGAEAVYLMGAFNNWSTTRTPMRRIDDDQWEVQLPAWAVDEALRVFAWEAGQRHGRLVPASVQPVDEAVATSAAAAPPIARGPGQA